MNKQEIAKRYTVFLNLAVSTATNMLTYKTEEDRLFVKKIFTQVMHRAKKFNRHRNGAEVVVLSEVRAHDLETLTIIQIWNSICRELSNIIEYNPHKVDFQKIENYTYVEIFGMETLVKLSGYAKDILQLMGAKITD